MRQELNDAVVVPELAFGCSISVCIETAAQSTSAGFDSFSPETDGTQMANTAVLACSSVCRETVPVKKGCGVTPVHSGKIESSAGIASAALHWFYFCLTDHKQFVYIDSISSSTANQSELSRDQSLVWLLLFIYVPGLDGLDHQGFHLNSKAAGLCPFPCTKDLTKNLRYGSGRLSFAVKYVAVN